MIIRCLFIFLCLTTFPLYAQYVIEGYVVDKQSGDSISEAHVFIINSSFGVTTGTNGKFNIHVKRNGRYEIGITHINYQPHFMELEVNDNINLKVVLSPETHELEEIEVTAKASRKRMRYLNRFQEALFGRSRFTPNCKIANPEVLRFTEREHGGFEVKAIDILDIVNPDLGYEIHLYLEYFKKENLVIQYGVKVYFEEMQAEDPGQAKQWTENRKLAYLGSKRHFFEALLENNWVKEGFHINHVRISKNNELDILNSAKESEILIRSNNRVFLTIPEVLAVHYDEGRKGSLSVQEGIKSYLIPRANFIEITDPMAISDNQFEEMGFWSSSGISTWLPNDYRQVIKYGDEVPSKNGFILTGLDIPFTDILRGGPPKDGIQAIFRPTFIEKEFDKMISSDDIILGVNYNGIQKAYPLFILDRHQVVNDVFNNESVVISYCPLTNHGTAHKTMRSEKEQVFGVSGLLYNCNLLFYDLETESLWSQVLGKAICGKMKGESLHPIQLEIMSWNSWRNQFPATLLLDYPDGQIMPYSDKFYDAYRKSDKIFLSKAGVADMWAGKEMIIGVEINNKYKAYPISEIEKASRLEDVFAGTRIIFEFNANNETISIESRHTIFSARMYWFAWKLFFPETEIHFH